IVTIWFFFFQAEDGIRDRNVTGVQTCALPICIVAAVKQGADKFNLPHPHIISESGRALTAHHAVLVADIIDQEPMVPDSAPALDSHAADELVALQQQVENIAAMAPAEALDELQHLWLQLHQAYMAQHVSIKERAIAEQWY